VKYKKIYLIVIPVILVASFAVCLSRAGSFLVQKDEVPHGDVIVVLMGSLADRLLEAQEIYQNGKADKLLFVEGISDEYKELKARGADIVSGAKQAQKAAIAMGIPDTNIIILPGDAQSTVQEALLIREYLINRKEIDTLILVTSSSHTRRAGMIFRTVFKYSTSNIYISLYPSSFTDFDAPRWWHRKDDIEAVLLEYMKLFSFIIFERKDIKSES
jgi:uncharacterized SAM-binding protein YcdF (DUF218 family)